MLFRIEAHVIAVKRERAEGRRDNRISKFFMLIEDLHLFHACLFLRNAVEINELAPRDINL